MQRLVHVLHKVRQELEGLLLIAGLAAKELLGEVEHGGNDAKVVHAVAIIVPAALRWRVVHRVHKVEVARPRILRLAAHVVGPRCHRWQAARADKAPDRVGRTRRQVALSQLGRDAVRCNVSSVRAGGGPRADTRSNVNRRCGGGVGCVGGKAPGRGAVVGAPRMPSVPV